MAATRLPVLALVNGRILTMDPVTPVVPALRVEGERIAAVGGRDVAIGDGADVRVVDLAGRTVTPGLIDGHAHMDREGLRDRYPTLEHAHSIEDIVDTIRRLAAPTPHGEWIVTMPVGAPPFYFDPASGLAEGRLPDRHDLDRAAPNHPVYVRGIWGYWDRPPITSIANSAALARCGIDRATEPPCESVEIVRDDAGEPTGLFREHDPLPVLEFTLFRDVPRFSHEDRIEGIRIAQRRYHSSGVTGTYEAHGVSPDVLAAYEALHAVGELTMRCRLVASPTWTTPDGAADAIAGPLRLFAGTHGSGDDRLRTAGVFVGIGEPGCVARTLQAGLPYTGWAGFVEWEHPIDDFEAIARMAATADLRVHTLGNDEAIIAATLDALDRIDAAEPIGGRRWVLEHLRFADRRTLERIRALGLVVTTQPAGYIWKAGSSMVTGDADPEQFVPHRALDEAGVSFALSTDDKPYSSMWALWAAVGRVDRRTGRVLGPGQRLGVRRALRALTADAARLSFDEASRGVIRPGHLADLAIFNEDPEAVPVERLRDLPIWATVVGGHAVYGTDAALEELG
jgi:hypothetical protein